MKAQSFTMDLLIAFIFAAVIGVFLFVILSAEQGVQQQQQDAKVLAQTLSQPAPVPFNESTVIQPGFIQQGAINTSLLYAFQALDEDLVQRLTGISSQYFINVSDNNTLHVSLGTPPLDPRDVHLVTRYAAHNGTIASVEVIAWQ